MKLTTIKLDEQLDRLTDDFDVEGTKRLKRSQAQEVIHQTFDVFANLSVSCFKKSCVLLFSLCHAARLGTPVSTGAFQGLERRSPRITSPRPSRARTRA